MGFCLARQRGQEKIEDGLEKEQEAGEVEEAEMIEKGTNGRSECRMSRGVRGGVKSW